MSALAGAGWIVVGAMLASPPVLPEPPSPVGQGQSAVSPPTGVCVIRHVRSDIIDPFSGACALVEASVGSDLFDPFDTPIDPSSRSGMGSTRDTLDPFAVVAPRSAASLASVLHELRGFATARPQSPDLIDPFTVEGDGDPPPNDLRDPLPEHQAPTLPAPAAEPATSPCRPTELDGTPIQRPRNVVVPTCPLPSSGGAAERESLEATPTIVASRSPGVARP